MHKTRTRFAIALITFLVGVAATTLVLFKGTSQPQQADVAPAVQETRELKLVIPDARWEPSFFRRLDAHAKKVNLPSLRTVTLPQDDLELRFWYDALPDMLDGVVLRRSGNQWSATHIYGRYKRQLFPVEEKTLAMPKSGWEAVWGRLVGAGILVLPDASEAQCRSEALDGVGYVIEINANKTYRTYRYDNPQLMECSEAKRVALIEEIISDEFGLKFAEIENGSAEHGRPPLR